MTRKIKITSKERIIIPKILRDEIKVKEGMYLSVYIQDGNLILKPITQDNDKVKLIDYVYRESKGNIDINKVREMTKDFNLKMSKQVRDIREEEASLEFKKEK